MDFNDVFWDSTHTWRIIEFTSAGSSPDNFNQLNITSDTEYAAYGGFASANVGGHIDLTWNPQQAVPEPASALLLALGAFALVLRRRRR